jgi:precorrin-3B synthase
MPALMSEAAADPAMPTAGISPAEPADGPEPPDPVGLLTRSDGRHAAVTLVPLGVLTSAGTSRLAELAGFGELRITPWRSVVLTDVEPSVLVELDRAGLGTAADSPWYRLSACAGSQGCGKALRDVRTDAARSAGSWQGRRVHYSGCERCCGLPRDVEVNMLATTTGYRLDA